MTCCGYIYPAYYDCLNLFVFGLLDTCLTQIAGILQSKNARLVALASSLLWALLYDCEKCKVMIRNSALWNVLLGFEERELEAIVPDGEEDAAHLQDARENLAVVRKLLNM